MIKGYLLAFKTHNFTQIDTCFMDGGLLLPIPHAIREGLRPSTPQKPHEMTASEGRPVTPDCVRKKARDT